MKAVFVDTFHFLALLNRADESHARAKAAVFAARRQAAKLVTTAWVLTELADALAQPADRRRFSQVLAALRLDPQAVIVPPTLALFERGIARYESRPDKQWSLTDCISFVVMQDEGIEQVLTGDRHFEQAGFRALLR